MTTDTFIKLVLFLPVVAAVVGIGLVILGVRNKKRKSYIIKTSVGTVVLVVALIELSIFISKFMDEGIETVKNSVPSSIRSITYEQAIENYCTDVEWSYCNGEDGSKNGMIFIQADGKCLYDGKTRDIVIQFSGYRSENSTHENDPINISFIGFDGAKKTDGSVITDVLYTMFESYASANGLPIDESVKQGILETQACVDLQGGYSLFVPEETTQPVDEDDKLLDDKKNIDYESAYLPMLELTNASLSDDSMCDYSLFDFDDNGVKELILGYGACEADYVNEVYTIDENGNLFENGKFSGMDQLYKVIEGNGIYAVHESAGHEIVRHISVLDGIISEKELANCDTDAVYSNEYPIERVPVSDLSVLKSE